MLITAISNQDGDLIEAFELPQCPAKGQIVSLQAIPYVVKRVWWEPDGSERNPEPHAVLEVKRLKE